MKYLGKTVDGKDIVNKEYLESIIPTPTSEDENKHIVVLEGKYTLQEQSGGGKVTLVNWTAADIGG